VLFSALLPGCIKNREEIQIMGTRALSTISFNNNTLHLSECKDGFWLYDETRGMNLSMRAKTPEQAFTEALEYYQERLAEIESEHKILKNRVDSFISQFVEA
jgi:hypothetical protein